MARRLLWGGIVLAVLVRLALMLMGAQVHLSRRVEVVTPVTSLMRLAEGHWLKKLGLSPYAGSAYHGSPLLLGLLGPLTVKGAGGLVTLKTFSSFLVFVAADLIGALLLHAIGASMSVVHDRYMSSLQEKNMSPVQVPEALHNPGDVQGKTKGPVKLEVGTVAALFYVLNPFTIAVCVGGTTTPIENMLVILSLYGALAGNTPLATFGWAISTHLSLYPAVLIVPVTLLTICGPDRPQKKVLDSSREQLTRRVSPDLKDSQHEKVPSDQSTRPMFSRLHWIGIAEILLWSTLWWLCILGLCHLAVRGSATLPEVLTETYGFILSVADLSPNLGLFWYFFTEVFTQFRDFFIMVFHGNLLYVILPLTIRLHHRPLFLAFILVAISTLLKSYPSVGDAALTLALMSLCARELTGFRYTFLILYGYLFVAILSPSMYNLWIWKGTGNANFYFAMALVYSALQSILIVESVGTVLRFDRELKTIVEKDKAQLMEEEVKVKDNVQQDESAT